MTFDEHQAWLEEQIANQECDELLARLEERRLVEKSASDEGLIYKVNENALVREAKPMDDQSQREWNDWARRIAQEEATKASNQLVDDLDAHHEALHKRIADLEARIASLEEGKVIPFGGGRSASAHKS
jgi:hypothetical protein